MFFVSVASQETEEVHQLVLYASEQVWQGLRAEHSEYSGIDARHVFKLTSLASLRSLGVVFPGRSGL